MYIKEVDARIIKDSRGDKTIEVSVKTEQGLFSASSPSGKSKGKHEVPSYVGSIESDIKTVIDFSDDIYELDIKEFKDLEKIEKITKGQIGANSLFALETAILKAIAAEQGISLWKLINKKAKNFPFPVGNCIGGGLHTAGKKKPDFQEFVVIPKSKNFSENVFLMKKAHEMLGKELEVRKAKGKLNDENAWSTSLGNDEVLEIMKRVKEDIGNQIGRRIDIGIDAAVSSFFTGLIYNYKNPVKRLNKKQQAEYIVDIIDKYYLDYIEDPAHEEDFSGFAAIKKRAVRIRPTCIIVGDDLTVTQLSKLKKAEKSINALIIKPNQVGSLIELKQVVDLAKKKSFKIVFSHRSGETMDYALADLAFAFQADYIKTGVMGKERDVKLKRLIEIENSLS